MLQLAGKANQKEVRFDELSKWGIDELVRKRILFYIWDILSRRKKLSPIRFNELFDKVEEKFRSDENFSWCDLVKSRVKRVIVSENSNLALFSNGAELYIARATEISIFEKYVDLFTPMVGNSQATKRRRVARAELANKTTVSTEILREAVARGYGIGFLIDSFWTVRWAFVIKSVKEGVFITFYHRLMSISIVK